MPLPVRSASADHRAFLFFGAVPPLEAGFWYASSGMRLSSPRRPTIVHGRQNRLRTLARGACDPRRRSPHGKFETLLVSWTMSNSALCFGRPSDAWLQSSLGQLRVLADQVLDDLVCVLVRSGRSRVDLDIVGGAVVQVLEQGQTWLRGLCLGSLGRGSMTCDTNIATGTENGTGGTWDAHRTPAHTRDSVMRLPSLAGAARGAGACGRRRRTRSPWRP